MIPNDYRDLVGAPHYAHIATVNADGSPQSTVVWVRADGDDVIFTTGARYRKTRNMAREPRVAMSIHDANDPYRCVELRGVAELEPRTSYDLLDELAQRYLGVDEYPDKDPNAEGVLVRIKVERGIVHHARETPARQPLPDGKTELMGPPHFGHVVTITPDGQPCSSPVWVCRDGDDVRFWTSAGNRKVKNLEHNPAIAISAHDETNPLRYAEVRGVAELTNVPHADLLDELARAYWQVDEYPDKAPGMTGVEVRVEVRHRSGWEGR